MRMSFILGVGRFMQFDPNRPFEPDKWWLASILKGALDENGGKIMFWLDFDRMQVRYG